MKKAVLTGSTGGLGAEIAILLAEKGWDLILLNRSEEKSAEQLKALRSLFPRQTFDALTVDLMDVESIRQVCDELVTSHPEIHALYSIAGLLTDQRVMSKQNIEGHFAVNTVAPYALMQLLKEPLKAAAKPESPSVIVNFSSEIVTKVKKLNVSKLTNPDTIGGLMDAYAKTKLAVNMMGCLMRDALFEDNITLYSVDPGATKTQMTDGNKGMPLFIRLVAPLLFHPADKQAKKLVDAVSDAVTHKQTGLFISNGKVKKQPALAEDKALQEALRVVLETCLRKEA